MLTRDCGSNSEYGTLRTVLMHRPGRELDDVVDPRAALFLTAVRPEIARLQHDHLATRLAAEGVNVKYIDMAKDDRPNLYFCRDLILATAWGVVVCRPALAARQGEEEVACETLAAAGVPAAVRIASPGTLEGGDVSVASPDLVLIGRSQRTNVHGAGQLEAFLRSRGVKNVHMVLLHPDTLHLDMVFAMLDRDLAAVSEKRTPDRLRAILAHHHVRVIELPDHEVNSGMALNLLCLGPRRIMIPSGNPVSRRRLEQQGVACIPVEVSELMRGGGAIHCMTAVLKRDLVLAN